MIVAVINSGSSSLKFKLFDMSSKEILQTLLVEHIGEKGSNIRDHHDALESLDVDFTCIDIIGHRVVHGGEEFREATIVDESVLIKIQELSSLAPLHNPANLEGIIVARKKAPNALQIAVFDTAFHAQMPQEAYLYALPFEMYEKHKIRRYGFHGTSHSYLLKESAIALNKDTSQLNIITLHLGNGASVCAIENGISVDTSMGFTPLEGLVMGTRSGDIDPAIVVYMQRELGLSVDDVDNILNKKSGLLGICESSDIREILESNSEKSKLALNMMIRRIKKYIGAYMALLGRVDAIVFSGGIGENSEYIRDEIMNNNLAHGTPVLVIKTDEELEIAKQCLSF
ncbi:Acetate kinase [Sulfurimonas gotlandica GD1]|uniref:Acetate kinase n=1 Tax=Sulfurimonas gotlandica (strain DSM 19862 / JCM 16533 / GD1) TaxID=929558 RepID=B6BKP5_SULGG|nr:acetate kinase [Sulfurimonas gotlandica]EDZ62238.1 acetate kinase [Sulfurimonas gotlandica GD1]EHP29104.1 Acetate kinase [Sulfurimonas gotlandica GD1]